MLPIILGLVGSYLIVDSQKDKFEDGGQTDESGMLIIKSGKDGKLKEIFRRKKNQRNENLANEIFDEEKSKGKSVFIFVDDELFDSHIQESDKDKYAYGGMTVGRFYKDNDGKEYRFIGKANDEIGIFADDEKQVRKPLSDFGTVPKKSGLFGFFEDGGKLNYVTENGINFDIDFKDKTAIVTAKIEDEENYLLDKKDLREMSETARIKGINKVELHTNYGLELKSSEKPQVVGFDVIKKKSYAKGGKMPKNFDVPMMDDDGGMGDD